MLFSNFALNRFKNGDKGGIQCVARWLAAPRANYANRKPICGCTLAFIPLPGASGAGYRAGSRGPPISRKVLP
jgi:hypothetical protein